MRRGVMRTVGRPGGLTRWVQARWVSEPNPTKASQPWRSTPEAGEPAGPAWPQPKLPRAFRLGFLETSRSEAASRPDSEPLVSQALSVAAWCQTLGQMALCIEWSDFLMWLL